MIQLNRRAAVKAIGSFVGFSGVRLRAQPQVQVAVPAPIDVPPAGGGEEGIVDMGTTYHSFERRATRAVTTFSDGSAVSQRTADGRIDTQMLDRLGNYVSQFRVDRHPDGANEFVAADVAGDVPGRVSMPGQLIPTLDWANVQARLYGQDATRSGSRQWRGALLRRRGAQRSTQEVDVHQVETEFDDGKRAVTRRGGTTAADRATWTTRLYHHDAHVGTLRWSAKYRVFEWYFPTINARGYVTDERMATVGASWRVLPTMAWANVQALVSYELLSKMAAKRTASAEPRNGVGAALRGMLNAVIVPLYANEPGCDWLHWLDYSVFRPCCDAHDYCYAANGCSAWSWFFWGSWSCNNCNRFVIYCFEATYIYNYYCDPYMLTYFGQCIVFA